MIFTVPFLSSNKHIVQMNVMINIVQSLIACISHWCCLAEIYLQVLCNFPVDKSLHPLKLLASTFGLAHSECVFFLFLKLRSHCHKVLSDKLECSIFF